MILVKKKVPNLFCSRCENDGRSSFIQPNLHTSCDLHIGRWDFDCRLIDPHVPEEATVT